MRPAARTVCVTVQFIVVAITLLSCTNGRHVAAYYANRFPSSSLDSTYLNEVSASVIAARRYLSDKTVRTFSPGHGTQIEYTDANGTAFLWYPGNLVIVEGSWKVETREGVPQVCFLYPESTRNPVTLEIGGNWECVPAKGAFAYDYERLQGNPFDLKPGPVPTVISHQTSITFSDLQEYLKVEKVPIRFLKAPRNS